MDPSAPDDVASLRAFVEKARIREVLESYFHGLDAREEDLIAACFSDDAVATYHSGSDMELTLTGGAAMARYFCDLFRTFTATNHAVSNSLIQITADTATADTFAIAHVIIEDRVRVRGLKYLDELVLVSQVWRISKRTHIQLWQYEADAVRPSLPR